MSENYETTQQILTYLIEFFGFLALFVLPAEYIIKCHIDEVRSWGVPGEGYLEMSTPNQVTRTETIVEKIETPKIERKIESEKSTKTKKKRTRKKNIQMIPA
jgi:hypothetical protein